MSGKVKLRIESDGKVATSHVYVVDEQNRKSKIAKVQSFEVRADVRDGPHVEATITVLDPEVNFEIEDGLVKFEGRL